MTYAKRGILIRLVYLFVAILFFIMSKILCTKKKTVVLCYHGVKDSQRQRFLKQLSLINNRVIATKSTRQDKKSVSIELTFDDAFANLIKNVIPGITEMELPITIFIPAGNLGATPLWLHGVNHADSYEKVMTVNQLLSLKANPMVNFGSHTLDHPRLSLLEEEEVRTQLIASRDFINKIIEKEITELALPHGDYNEAVIHIALEVGYKKIYTLEPLVSDVESSDSVPLIGRFTVTPNDWPIEFYLTSHGSYAWLATWRSMLNNVKMLI